MATMFNSMIKKQKRTLDPQLWRDFLAYWILGLCTNYGYVVVISAAHDILNRFDKINPNIDIDDEDADVFNSNPYVERVCNSKSTGILLLADIIPSLIMNIIFPFFPCLNNFYMIIVCHLQAAGFILVANAGNEWQAILGVICTSLSLGIGEVTLLSYSSKFNNKVISFWSAGTGAAGIIGAFSYAGLIEIGISPKNTLLIMLAVPACEALAFWLILRKPRQNIESAEETNDCSLAVIDLHDMRRLSKSLVKYDAEIEYNPLTKEDTELNGFKEKLYYMPSLLKFIIPLVLVFLFEYIINSGLFEMIYFRDIWLDHKSQYRWFQVFYQIGVFVSRSTGNLLSKNSIWWMPFFQFINIFYFAFEAVYASTPTIWITFGIVFWVGTLGGLAYVNTFYKMLKDVPPARQNFALGVVTVAESIGIAVAGLVTIPIHGSLCN